MGLFDHFPYTNVHELNLDWVLSMMKALEAEWEAFTAGNSLQFADPLQHDISKTYAKNTIVLDGNGNAYVSLQAVPVGVGLQNRDYWLMVFDYEAFIEKVNKNFTARYYRDQYRATAAIAIGDWLTVDDVLCKATAAIAADDVLEFGVNIEHFTLEDFIKAFMTSANQMIQQYKNDIDASELQYKNEIDASELAYRNQLAQDIATTTENLQRQLDLAISGATVDSEVINARLGADGITYPTLGNAIRAQAGSLYGALAGKTDLHQYLYSENNNYMDNDNYTTGGYFNPSSGEIVSGANWKYKYQPIPFAGTFKIRRSVGEWGANNQIKIPLYNGDLSFNKTLTGTAINNDVVEFTITEDDYKFAAFIGVSSRFNTFPDPMLIVDADYPTDLVYRQPIWNFKNRLSDNAIISSIKLNDNYVSNGDLIDGYWSGTVLQTLAPLSHVLIPIQGSGDYIKREYILISEKYLTY